MSCGAGCRCGLNLAWLWLWRRSVATAPIQRLAWEPLYAAGVAIKRQKKKKKLGFSEFLSWLSGNKLTSIPEDSGSIRGLTQWVIIWRCHELWCRLQTRLGSLTAVAVA